MNLLLKSTVIKNRVTEVNVDVSWGEHRAVWFIDTWTNKGSLPSPHL